MIKLNRWIEIKCELNGYKISNERYYISKTGIVYDMKKDKILKPNIDRYGYCRVGLRFDSINGEDSIWKTIRIHQLMSFAFLGNSYDNYQIINHKDGNKQNNHIDNLELCTHSQNTKHAYDLGLEQKYFGEKNHYSKYTDNDTENIAKLLNKYPRYPYQYILELAGFDVNDEHMELIRSIESGKSHPYLKKKYDLVTGQRYISKGKDKMMWFKVEKICKLLESGIKDKKTLLKMADLDDNELNRSNLKHIIHRTGYKSITKYFNY